jgi:hypothetical protein
MRTTAFLVILEHDYDRFDKDAADSIKRSLELVKGVAEAIDTQALTQQATAKRRRGKPQPQSPERQAARKARQSGTAKE